MALLAFVESVVLCAGFYLGVSLRFAGDLDAAAEAIGSLFPRAIVFTIVAMAALLSMGLYGSRQSARLLETIMRLGAGLALAAFIDATLYYLLPGISTGRGAQVLALVAAFLGLAATRATFYALVGNERFKRNVLVYGSGELAASQARHCATLGHRSFSIVGYLGVLGEDPRPECVPLLSRSGPLLDFVRDRQIDEIVVSMDNRRNGFPMRELLDCRLAGVKISEALTFTEKETGRIDLQALHPSWLIYGSGFRQGALHRSLKRLFDVIISLLLLVLALPLLALAAVAIFVESGGRGGVLLRQERVGLHGQVFKMLKLRSMVPDAEHDGRARWASAGDPRITRVGALTRRFRIDELPQILNVLKGEMSFVGPRPERPEFVRQLSEQIPFYRERHCVKPGLAGWAQLCYPYGSSLEDARQKLQYDLFYIKNKNAMFDFLILLETLEVVIWGNARNVETEEVEAELERAAPGRHVAARNASIHALGRPTRARRVVL